MIHLAIETSGSSGSVALFERMRPIATVGLPAIPRMAVSLGPAIDELIRTHLRHPRDIGMVSTTTGPGSFTGIRIAVATTKALGFALGVPVFGEETLRVIAEQVAQELRERGAAESISIEVGVDAYRQLVFCCSYRFQPVGQSGLPIVGLERLGEIEAVPRNAWYRRLEAAAGSGPVVACGSAIRRLEERVPGRHLGLSAACHEPTAEALAKLAWAAAQSGQLVAADGLVPLYVRPSAAEEQRQTPARDGENASC
jgi:tRNA threonylcarbamoyl adenosine modification protein YeaZ